MAVRHETGALAKVRFEAEADRYIVRWVAYWPLAERGVRILGSLGPTIPAGAEPRDGADEWRAALRLELSGMYSSFGETRGVGGASRAEAREPLTPVWTVTSDPPGFARLDSVHRDGSGVFRATLVADTRSLPAYTLRVDVRVELEDIFGARAVDAVRFDAWPLRRPVDAMRSR